MIDKKTARREERDERYNYAYEMYMKQIHTNKLYRLVEILLWLFISYLLGFSFWSFDLFNSKHHISTVFIISFCTFLVVIIFKLVFLKYPIEYLRSKVADGITHKSYTKFSSITERTSYEDAHPKETSSQKTSSITELNSRHTFKQLSSLVSESKHNADHILSLSRVYIFLGCVIAFSGVALFYVISQFDNSSLIIKDAFINLLGSKILEILPRFGILFFVEYIALFFLKQYRVLMEEYRYYESIKRERQDLLSVYLMINELSDKKEVLNILLDYIDKHAAVVPQITGTHKLKTEKIVYDDLDFISKITSLVQAIKSNEKAKGD